LSPSIAIDVWDAYHTKLRFFTTEDTGDTEIKKRGKRTIEAEPQYVVVITVRKLPLALAQTNFKISQSIVEAVARVKFPVSLLEAVATGLWSSSPMRRGTVNGLRRGKATDEE
jgi:hypothetical protein